MKLGYSLTRGSHGHGTHNINGLVLSSFLQRFPVQLLQITKTQLDYNWETTCTRTWSLVSRDFNCLKINFYEGVYKVWARVLPQVLLLWDQQVGFHLKVWLSGFFWLQGCVVSSSCTSLIVMKHSITGSQLVRFMILFTVVKVTVLFLFLCIVQFHYIIYGSGFQTWEYSPAYALRSYSYILLHVLPMLLTRMENKVPAACLYW